MKTTAIAILTIMLAATMYSCLHLPTTSTADVETLTRGEVTDTICIARDAITADIPGVDSLVTFSLCSPSGKEPLFSVAPGGNIEHLADTILTYSNGSIAAFTFADYFQTDQIFYIWYDCQDKSIRQSERINLPCMYLTDDNLHTLQIDSITADSVYVHGRDLSTAARVTALDCDSSRIINYYEYR